ncbi:DUF4443 domain-containing protein [Thermococcus argininiproducens]|uniref:DUF4443 domain-containing protein n=1 Tax=Thermococcus argininiproducens TaxID=2866384 RepID=A0A9E7MAN2_9EURY|nr:DUF4443 domain-containing protein [Thermococcus argininiproducens]USG99766.1 DUF4443 domain-containing protein [Thermococcus argininiproducens]
MDWKRGAYPEFKMEDVLITLFLVKTPKGRKQISEELSLGEGTVRTLLKKLAASGLIESQQKGHFLSEKGIKVVNEISTLFSEPVEIEPIEGFPACALIVKNPPEFKSIELRDEAIRFFAKGAMILLCSKGEVIFPEDRRPLKDTLPEIDREVKRLPLKDGDLVVITWAESRTSAIKSAIHVAVVLKGDLLPSEIRKLAE